MAMKNINKIIGVLAAAVLLTSCLEENSLYTVNSSILFSDEDNVELALLGCYGYMTSTECYGQMMQEVPIVGSGYGWSQRNGQDGDDLAGLEVKTTNAVLARAWDGLYKVIAETNAFIEAVEACELGEDVKVPYIAEARFVRAVCYFALVCHWGDVPLKLTASTADGIAIPRTAKEEVFEAIIADFEDGAANMETSSSVGRGNAWAAKAYLAKVYYKMAMLEIDTEASLAKAKEYFDEVYERGPYALESSYAGLFAPYNSSLYVSNSSEVIFQLNFNSSSTVCFNRSSNRFAPQASTSGINWSTYRVEKFMYDLQLGTYWGDPRMQTNYLSAWRYRSGNSQSEPVAQLGDVLAPGDSTYAYPYNTLYGHTDTTILYKIPYELFEDITNPKKSEFDAVTPEYAMEKYGSDISTNITNLWSNFTTPGDANKWPFFGKLYDITQTAQRANLNLILFRYGEFLLEMADVYNELGQTTRAIELANEVLTRARNITSPASSEPANWSLSLSQEEVTEKLFYERIFETVGEPCAYEMPRIRGTVYLEKFLLKHNNHEMTVYADSLYYTNVQNISDRVLNNGEKDAFDPDFLKRNLLLPIPTSEIDANAAISNSDNNYGY